ncbi:MAG: peptidyl-prolyl cis-trans isomerase [Desulfovibrionaceae bacterium]|nr:peptidyl-prolyl cis-trans isomerase [Desulfovibrionaceae bacterium]
MSNPIVVIETNKGDIRLELDQDKAPNTVANFLRYAEDGFYADTLFHRVIPDFMIQGGGMDLDLNQKPTPYDPIANEGAASGLKNLRGSIAMARTNDPDSATSQFFINLKDNAFLDYNPAAYNGDGYAVFGRVIEGMEVVDAIAAVSTGFFGYHADVPLEAIIIKAVRVE